MKRYVVASVLTLPLAVVATAAQAQGSREDLNQLLQALEQARAQMYTMARSDKSMMAGVKNLDRTITMMKKRMAGPKRRAR
jgi:hypothetical protein